jgi:hypothetical protein
MYLMYALRFKLPAARKKGQRIDGVHRFPSHQESLLRSEAGRIVYLKGILSKRFLFPIR